MIRDTESDPSKLRKRGGRTKRFTPDSIVPLLSADGQTAEEWLKATQQACKMSDRTFYRCKKEAEEAGKIHNVGGKWIPRTT